MGQVQDWSWGWRGEHKQSHQGVLGSERAGCDPRGPTGKVPGWGGRVANAKSPSMPLIRCWLNPL